MFIVLILLFMILTGCDEQSVINKTEELDTTLLKINHYALPEKKKVMISTNQKEIIPEEIKRDGLPKVKDIVNAILSSEYLEEKQAKSWYKNKKSIGDVSRKKIRKNKNYLFEDVDYKKLDIKSKEFTYPVNRDRILTRDVHIHGILEDAINSQIPGKARILIDQDILSPSMRYILLPYYSRIICNYEGLKRTGQTRLVLNCTEIIRPDGARILMSNASVGDIVGRNGLIGKVDNRVWQMYSGAFLVASIASLAQVSEGKMKNETLSRSTNHLSNQFGLITSKVLEKNIDLRPVMNINAGSRLILKLEQDLVFPEPIIQEVDLKNEE